MSSKTLNPLRVVVHINKGDPVDNNETFQNNITRCEQEYSTSPSKNSLQPLEDNFAYDKMKAEILLVNDKSLQLNLMPTENVEGSSTTISHKMQFDHVSDSVVEMLKSEFALVTDELVVKRKNSCIMRFGIKQEMDIKIFFDLLIKFLIKRIYLRRYKLQYVKLECLNVAGSLGCSKMPPSTETDFARRANLDNSDDDCNDNSVTYRLPGNATNDFLSTPDLVIWFLNEYNQKFADGKGHEKLQFLFSIVDRHQNVFKVKFSLFNIFLNLMNAEDRNHWHNYMDHIGEGCQGVDCHFIHSGLTFSLSNHIDRIARDNVLFFFYTPSNIEMTAEIIHLLQMATSIMRNRSSKLVPRREKRNPNNAFLQMTYDCINYFLPNRNKESTNDPPLNNKVRHSLPSPVMSNNLNGTLSGSFCGNERNLYRKIDECFENICKQREEYFNCFFKFNIKDISINIKSICKTLEALYTNRSEKDLIELHEYRIELQESFERYRSAETLFRQLTEHIKNSDADQALKVYLDTKTSEFNNNALSLKRKNLEWCQRQLNYSFDYVLTDLKLSI